MSRPLGIRLDPRKDPPLVRQLFDAIAARIRTGAFPPGYRLPPTRTLAQELGVHRNTVVHAYEELVASGFLVSTVGRGTFVPASGPAPEAPRTDVPASGLPWASLVSRAADVEPLRRFDRLARSAATHGAIDLSHLQPGSDLLPVDLLRRCIDHVLRTQGSRALAYPPRDGVPRLREAIAADLNRQGIPASAADVLVTSGSQQGLDVVARTLVNPGDVFLVDPSTYAGALNLLSVAGARLVAVPPEDSDGPDLRVLERLERTGAKGFYLMPGCHNPTARAISAERRQALVEWSRRAGVPLVEDAYVADLDVGGPPVAPALRTLDADVIHLGSYSKRLIPALRIGYVLCPPALLPRLRALKHAMDLGSSPILQLALAEFLERGYLRAHLARILPEYRRRREALEAGLAATLPRGLRWRSAREGLFLWIPLPAGVDPVAVFDEARRLGVLVSPSSLNTVSEGVDAGEMGVRLTFCIEPPDRLARAGRRVGQAIAAVLGRERGRSHEEPVALGAV